MNGKMKPATIRKASLEDAEGIKLLVDKFKFQADGEGQLMPLSDSDISLVINNGSFYVADICGALAGCGSVAEYDGIAELRSLVVEEASRGKGIGTAIIAECLKEAIVRGHKALYALTQKQNYALFERAGFARAEKPSEKLKKDCKQCSIYETCNETAFVIQL